jgi:hypothetical protein
MSKRSQGRCNLSPPTPEMKAMLTEAMQAVFDTETINRSQPEKKDICGRSLAKLETEIAQSWMAIRAAPERPVIFTV